MLLKSYEMIRCLILNDPYIPSGALDYFTGPRLLHISDTPGDIYPFIKKVIEQVNPQYIVHTGDMADDIKLETSKEYLDEYEKKCQSLIEMLETSSTAYIYYVMGNHDNQRVINNLVQRGEVLTTGRRDVEGRIIYLNHYYIEPLPQADFYLFGHDLQPDHFEKDNLVGLNGVLHINIIDLASKKVLQLAYPIDTNRLRKYDQTKIGL